MELQALPDWIESEFEFPVERSTVLHQAGNRALTAPDPDDNESLATVLDRAGEETYGTPAELLATIRGNLGEAYVGRKFYDDRGSNPPATDHGEPQDPVDSI